MGQDQETLDTNGSDDASAEVDETANQIHIKTLYEELSKIVQAAGKERGHTMEGVLRAALALAKNDDRGGTAATVDGHAPAPAVDEVERARAQTTAVLVGGRRESDTIVTPTTVATADLVPDAAIQPGMAIHQYELIRQIGSGGMGAVHLARDTKLGRRVAIKFLQQPGGGLNDRFLIEAQATARCNHENIVVIHDFGEHEGRPYMVLEYIEGQSLSSWLSERARNDEVPGREPLSPSVAVEFMIPVVRALVCAHEMGIVHRDLKPANIMLTSTGAVKVLDFGIAKLLQPVGADTNRFHSPIATAPGVLIGTLPYMSPEQLRGEPVDHRTDIWAVGIMLFEMVTGVHPTRASDAGKRPNALLAALLNATDIDTPMPSAGELRPDLSALGGIIDRCLLKNPEHRISSARLLLAELETFSKASRGFGVSESTPPFAGLSSFQESDSARFFGREHNIAELVMKLRSQPMITVAGPSGTGKSSLVRAGIIPALKHLGEGWEAITLRPGREPLAALAAILMSRPWESLTQHSSAYAESGHLDRAAITSRLRKEPGYLSTELRAWARARLRQLVIFVDQFEELYTLGTEGEERQRFLACIHAVADDAASPLRVILTVRSDFLDRIVEDRTFMDAVNRGLVFLSPLDRAALRMALIKPVEACEYRFENMEMVELILDELITARGALPLLQFTASKLWAKRDRQRRLITEASLHELGGVAGALADHADAVLATMTARDVKMARAIFLRLVTPERTRGLATLTELRQLGPASEGMDRVLGHLIEARLLAVDSGDGGKVRIGEETGTVEITHESLIDTWPLLGRWLDESQDDAVFLARLRSATKDWERSNHAAGLLWTGEAAREARTWKERYQGELAPSEQRYLAAVRTAAERSRRTRRRLVVGVVSAAMTVTVTTTYLAWLENQASKAAMKAADRAEQEATRASREALRARDATRIAVMQTLPDDPTTQLALLREIEAMSAPPPGASKEAKRLLYAGVASAVLEGHDDVVWSASFSLDGTRIVSASRDKTVRVWSTDGTGDSLILRGHDEGIRSAAFNPEGTRIVSASGDKTVRVWRADGSGEPLVLRGHDGGVNSAAFSPDGTLIVSASEDKTVRVWRADGSGEPLVLRGHSDVVWSASFSPDGTRIVSASADKTVKVWLADGSGEPLVLRGHEDMVWSASFNHDGTHIVSASADKSVHVWSADGSGAPVSIRDNDLGVRSALFSPDGIHIVLAAGVKTVKVWRADGSGDPIVLRGHDDAVMSASFSADGKRIVSASYDKAVRVWRLDAFGEPSVFRGHVDGVWSASFSPDGARIVSSSEDKTLRVWRTDGLGDPIVLHGHDSAVISALFSPDGTRVVSASFDKTVRVWNADGSGKPMVLRGHDNAVTSASFSPDGTRIVSSSLDKTVRLWHSDGSGEPLVLRGHDNSVWSASFSPDGARIVSASGDKTVRVWRADGSTELVNLRGHDDVVWSASFSPDGQKIVSASFDKTVRVWPADGSAEPTVLRGHNDWISWAEVSPDGMRIVSSSKDKTIRIWNIDGSGEPVILAGHSLWVTMARFSPDGRSIVSASDDQTVQVWHDLAPVRLDDRRLWTATTYCMAIERRIELLGVSEEQAESDRQHCLKRVEQVRRAEAIQPQF